MPNLSLNLLQQEIDYVVFSDDIQGAFECYNLVKSWLEKNGWTKTKPPEYFKYHDYLMKLKFLSLNYFDDVGEYYDLLKNYFSLAQEIPDFDLLAKLETQLISMGDVNERDVFKVKLCEALEKSENLIIERQKYNDVEMPNKVSEWIKDFIANLGLDRFDKLKKMEYLANSKHIRLLDEKDKNKVKNLLDIYEKLKLSSKTPEGYENVVAMNIDGRNIIFNHGEIEEVSRESLKEIRNKSVSPQPESDLFIVRPQLVIASGAQAPISEITDLEEVLKNYLPASLEHKAISQEISRLKVLELKAAQKSDAKK